jgi:hypothetical protein
LGPHRPESGGTVSGIKMKERGLCCPPGRPRPFDPRRVLETAPASEAGPGCSEALAGASFGHGDGAARAPARAAALVQAYLGHGGPLGIHGQSRQCEGPLSVTLRVCVGFAVSRSVVHR